MDALITSTMLVALAEMGDKTQLLAMLLAARFHRPVPVIAGILVATIVNHFLAALLGAQVAGLLDSAWFGAAVAVGFIVMGLWTLIPDKIDAGEARIGRGGRPFLTTLATFFIVEIGDKTQVATIALGAQFHNRLAVTAGTTMGMMIANVPAVLIGKALAYRLPFRAFRGTAAALFIGAGLWMLARMQGWP
jgi:putative Ca2+/H+ antiporter (TMEM165/GDT1 family)